MEMILLVQVSGAVLGMLAVIFGAFGAHYLKRTISEALMLNFETGVRYQFYHALLLLLLGFNLGFTAKIDSYIAYCFIIGTILFSFSIYLLTLLSAKGKRIPLLGMLTPIGGLLLVAGWALLLYSFVADLL